MEKLPKTYDEARNESPYDLARTWGDVSAWPLTSEVGRTMEHDLQELAVMTALADWLRRWTPLTIHRAALGGATMREIMAATGLTGSEVQESWQEWAFGQRQLCDRSRQAGLRGESGLSIGAYNQAATALDCPEWSLS